MKKLFFETEKDGFYGWRSVGQNGFIKMVSMFFACRRERKITAM